MNSLPCPIRAAVAGILGLFALASCGDNAARPDASSGGAAQFDSGNGTANAKDAETSSTAPDLPALDAKPAVCPGGAGCACATNADCDTAFCIETPAGNKCAAKCVDACPDGFACKAVDGGAGDLQSVCVPKFLRLCDPCAASKDCQSLGQTGAACVDRGEAGLFCGSACVAKADCPVGYTCASATTAEGATAQQCVPEAGAAVCICSALASAKKLQTVCGVTQVPKGASAPVTCKGVRACGPEGLSACLAAPATAETCNGKDDDCDGQTDEVACDDGNPCTADICDKNGCSHSPTQGPCDADGSACTAGDACAGGVCVAGSVVVCDDKNPCTADACLPASGCTATNDDGKGCDADGDACTAGDACSGGACAKGKPVACDDGNACTDDTCVASAGCVFLANAATCDDGDPCTQGDACKAQKCVAGANQCLCTADADCAALDDGNPCTGVWVCDKASGGAAKCAVKAGSVVVCGGSNDSVCAKNACDAKTGNCAMTSINIGGSCVDGNACTTGDSCGSANGQPACVSGKPTVCNDANPCTADSCDAVKGCVYAIDAKYAEPCYAGPADLAGKGACKAGSKTCGADGTLGACLGSVLPAPEACNGVDDDCNGATDEGCKAADFAVAVSPFGLAGAAGQVTVEVRAGRALGGEIAGSKHNVQFWLWSWLTGLWGKP